MNMRDWSTLHLDTNKIKGITLVHGHSRDFINENSSYPKTNVKRPIACGGAVRFTLPSINTTSGQCKF
jgi:hypothetical protein